MNNLENEIAELQKMIEAKRDQLEKEGGIIEEKELVRLSVREMFLDTVSPRLAASPDTTPWTSASVSTSTNRAQPNSANVSYLDYLDDETASKINELIADLPSRGVASTIDKVVNQEPFVIDAFHDALVDKLYDELKARGFVT